MTPKSILFIATTDDAGPGSLDRATEIARDLDAHLDVAALAIDRAQAGFNYTEISASLLETSLREAREAARDLAAEMEEALDGTPGLRYGVRPVVAPAGALGQTMHRLMRFSDLVVSPRPYGPAGTPSLVDSVECALFNANCPVLTLPPDSPSWTTPRRIVLAWNESDEALRAARAALPFLTGDAVTYITVIAPPSHGPDRSDPGGLLGQALARHGVRCEIDVLARSMPRIGDVILRQLQDRDADLLVMGAYGRARWSEAMFGGATRQMLEDAPIPVFMTH